MDNTAIEWTDATWNPVTGCTKVSPGCAHCYAEGVARRFWKGRTFNQVQCHEDRLDQPLRWKRPRRIFVNSMSDLFHPDVPDSFIRMVFDTMTMARHHTFQVLTKRPRRMADFLKGSLALSNIWLGVSVEDQARADERIPLLMKTPAAVRFLSMEPLLGPVDIRMDLDPDSGDGLHWVIVGGESGRQARPMHEAWALALLEQCTDAGVPFFFKQWGEHDQTGRRVGKKTAGRLLAGREWSDFPKRP